MLSQACSHTSLLPRLPRNPLSSSSYSPSQLVVPCVDLLSANSSPNHFFPSFIHLFTHLFYTLNTSGIGTNPCPFQFILWLNFSKAQLLLCHSSVQTSVVSNCRTKPKLYFKDLHDTSSFSLPVHIFHYFNSI